MSGVGGERGCGVGRSSALALAACFSVFCRAGSAQYTGVALYPLTAPGGGPTGPPGIFLNPFSSGGAGGGQTVGGYQVPLGDSLIPHAILWLADGTPFDLNRSQDETSMAYATNGAHQVGYGTPQTTTGFHALLWSGSPASAIDLHPTGLSGVGQSVAYGLSATQQVGQGYSNLGSPNPIGHALLWNGSAASVVDLNPTNLPGVASSLAYGTDGTNQVGWSSPGTQPHHALLWSGTAASAVDLNPGGFVTSMAFGVSGNQQVGTGLTASGGGGALLWTGSASSAVHLRGNEAVATNGKQQVGDTSTTGSNPATHAVLWSGTATSMVDLHPFLPPGFGSSWAASIDSAGDVFGWAGKLGGLYAVEWLPHPVLPGDANLDGKVDFNDLTALARHYGQTAGWAQGDFDQDGKTDFNDLVILARHYGQTLTGSELASLGPSFRADVAEAFAVIPEPGALRILVLATLLNRRRR